MKPAPVDTRIRYLLLAALVVVAIVWLLIQARCAGYAPVERLFVRGC